MALKNIGLCHIDPHNRAEGKFTVTINSDGGNFLAVFDCNSEQDGLKLRDAIRQHAARLLRVIDYRDPR